MSRLGQLKELLLQPGPQNSAARARQECIIQADANRKAKAAVSGILYPITKLH